MIVPSPGNFIDENISRIRETMIFDRESRTQKNPKDPRRPAQLADAVGR